MADQPHDPHAEENWEEQARTAHVDDAWHSHTGEEPPQHEHGAIANPVGIVVVTVVSIAVVVAIVVFVMIYFEQRVRAVRVEREERADFSAFVADQRVKAQEWMGDYGWIDPSTENPVIRIPIDRAIEITAEEYAGAR